MKRYLKTFEQYNKPIVVYHGTNTQHDFTKEGNQFNCNGTFFSTDKDEAGMYARPGNIIYEVLLKPNLNIFNTENENDCQKLFDEFEVLYDDDGRYYDDDNEPDEHYITSAEQLSRNNNNWKVIEETPNVIEWLYKNYDGVIIFEGGDKNYLIFKPVQEKIQHFKLLD